jgi:hypothetical protein
MKRTARVRQGIVIPTDVGDWSSIGTMLVLWHNERIVIAQASPRIVVAWSGFQGRATDNLELDNEMLIFRAHNVTLRYHIDGIDHRNGDFWCTLVHAEAHDMAFCGDDACVACLEPDSGPMVEAQ